MHFAAERGVQAAVRLLLDKGASAVIADSQGRLPFQLASGKTHTLLSKEAERQGSSALKHRWEMCHSNKRKEKTTPFGVNLMRSQVSYRAAQSTTQNSVHHLMSMLFIQVVTNSLEACFGKDGFEPLTSFQQVDIVCN